LCGTLLAVQIYQLETGCGSIDPTDPANYSGVRVVNDTQQSVVVGDCAGDYCNSRQPELVKSGQQFTDHAACAATGKDMTSWRVGTPDGHLIGYIAVDSPRSRRELVFRVSSATPDRAEAAPQG
jgi:hypothetical protein